MKKIFLLTLFFIILFSYSQEYHNKKINKILLPVGIATTVIGAVLVYAVIPSQFALVGFIFTVPIVAVGVAVTTISLLNKHNYNKHEWEFKTKKI